MSESQDIKEIMDIMDLLQALAIAGAKVGKDGKIGPNDLLVILDLLKDADKFKEAFTGLKEIPSEAKDLTEDEVFALLAKLFVIIKAVKSELE